MNGLKKLSERLPSLGGALDRSSELPQLTRPISETSSVIINPPSESSPDRYPIGARITAVNDGGATYDVIEVNSAGNDIADTEHTQINNISGAILSVNEKVPMFYCIADSYFFFGEAN